MVSCGFKCVHTYIYIYIHKYTYVSYIYYNIYIYYIYILYIYYIYIMHNMCELFIFWDHMDFFLSKGSVETTNQIRRLLAGLLQS